VLAALAHEPTDRVPRLLYEEVIGYTPSIQRLLDEKCAPQSPRDYFDMDVTSVGAGSTQLPVSRFEPWLGENAAEAIESGEVDEWGVRWRRGNVEHFTHIESPLQGMRDMSALEKYPWPDLDQPYRFAGLRERVDALHNRGLAVAAFAGSIFEQAWYLRGMQQLMIDMYESPRLARALLARTSHYQIYAAQQYARAGVDILITGDDVAAQNGMMLGIETWRDYLKPLQTNVALAVKAANPDTYVFYHSCGNIERLIPDLIEAGVEILNPLQPEAVDPAAIKRQYGDRLSFWGSVSVQRTLPEGTPAQVREEVHQRILQVARGGGLILSPAHVLSPEVPWQNIVAFFEAADSLPVPS
jgi:uroporphyrinogen decarboxylase